MNEKNINILALGSGILLTSLGLYFVMKSVLNQIQAKKEAELQAIIDAEIKGGANTPQEKLEQQQAKSYNEYPDVILLKGYLEGKNLRGYPEEVNGIINKLTDAQLKKLADTYKRASMKYGEKVSLYDQLVGEWNILGYSFYETSEKRLSNLGLR